MSMTTNYGLFFRTCRWIVRRFIPSFEVTLSSTSSEAVIYVGHHQNLYGPFMAYAWMPDGIRAWIYHVFLDQKACYEQYKNYTFTERFGWNKGVAAVIAMILSFFITRLLDSGRGIPVYRGSRDILKTFRKSVDALNNGEDIAVFPDVDYQNDSSETKQMYEGFLYIDKYYFRKTGKHVCFRPLYVSKNKRKIIGGEKVYFQGDMSFRKESKIILQQIQDNLNQLAKDCGDM